MGHRLIKVTHLQCCTVTCAEYRPVDSEESASNEDLFNDPNPSPSSTGQHCFESGTNAAPEAAVDDTNTDVDMDVDFDAIEEAQLDGELLDDCPEDENDSDGFEDGDQDNEVIEAMAVGPVTDGMDVDEGVATPRPHHEASETALPFQAGCVWTRKDWSCAYDAVFMAFFTVYWQSSPGWRGNWRRQSPEWTMQLADNFDLLLKALTSPEHSPESLSMLFSHLRDQFRDQLSNFNPRRFPRRGQLPTSVCAILELLFGSVDGPGIERRLSCASCGATSQTSHYFSLLALPSFSGAHRRETDPRFIPSATLLTRFVESLATPPRSSLCGACHGSTQAQLTMENSPWIWFETNGDHTMSPSPTVLIELSGQRLTYDLHSVIYLGADHFTVRMRDLSNGWWSYDGMRRFGAPQRDHIQITTDLLYSGCRYAAFLIYRRSDH